MSDNWQSIGAVAERVVAKVAPIERIAVTDRESWLAERKKDVTASVIGALFGLHPYQTPLGLFLEKTGFDMPEIDNAVLRRGRLLESAVAQAVAEERPTWKITKATEYLRDPKARIGATPDFYIAGDPRGRGVLQAKTVAPSVYRKEWTEDSPPFWIVLQNATEMMLADTAWGVIAALVVDPWKLDLHIYEVPRHPAAEKKLRDAVAQFWADVEAGREPKTDHARDGELMSLLYPASAPGKTIDLTGDNFAPTLLDEREKLAQVIKDADARKDEIETELKAKLGDAEAALINGWRLSWKTQHRKAYEVKAASFRVMRASREKAA
ncbi:MAG: putative conserved phage protein [Bradyrhizobium sp.]|nr:putative conserved phage protein [Bradyrhizobium sp.]